MDDGSGRRSGRGRLNFEHFRRLVLKYDDEFDLRRGRFVMRSVRRRGFTLLEVFLTLVISAVLIAAITSALNIHLRITESGRTEVEQAQLARALLGRIADDLRIAVPHIKPVPSIPGATSDQIPAAPPSAPYRPGAAGWRRRPGARQQREGQGGASSFQSQRHCGWAVPPLRDICMNEEQLIELAREDAPRG